jgi:(2Fe-2S) ferredoxin
MLTFTIHNATMNQNEPVYHKHIFVCTNERAPGAARRSCGQAHGMELADAFKQHLKDRPAELRVRAQRAGCLDICDFGPTVAVYPDGVFYVNVQPADVPEIVQEHILNNRPVERLMLKRNTAKNN